MNKRGSGVFRTIRCHSLALSVWAVCYTCFTAPAYNNCLYGQRGVRERDKRVDVPSVSPVRRAGGRRAKPFRIMVTTTPPAECRLSTASTRRTKGGNQIMQFKLEEGLSIPLSRGSYEVVAECKGYETHSMIVNVPLDTPSRSLSIVLIPLLVEVEVRTAPPEADVTLGAVTGTERAGRFNPTTATANWPVSAFGSQGRVHRADRGNRCAERIEEHINRLAPRRASAAFRIADVGDQ